MRVVMRWYGSSEPGRPLPIPAIALVLAALAAGGCSADVSRFDFPVLSLTDKGEGKSGTPAGSRVASPARPSPAPQFAGGDSGMGTQGYEDQRTSARRSQAGAPVAGSPLPPLQDGVRTANLQDPTYQRGPYPAEDPGQRAGAPATLAPRASGKAAPHLPAAPQTVDVQPGDTLYQIAKRHNVSLAALMQANGLSSPSIKPGQRLVLPVAATAGRVGRPSVTPAVQPSVAPHSQARPLPQQPQAALPAPTPPSAQPAQPAPTESAEGTYTVKPGDSLFALARKLKVDQSELARVNGITDPTKLKQGQVLKLPVSGAAPVAQGMPGPGRPLSLSRAGEVRPPAAPASTADARPASDQPAPPSAVNAQPSETDEPADEVTTPPAGREKVASLGGVAAGPTSKLRWPVRGRVIAGFGSRPDGRHNDGINIAVPHGIDVHAAEAGTVAYVGPEVQSYGNLVLIRHEGEWITAYAHNDQILVKRGDRVRRGQVIAKAGKTGAVDQPQVHFELRQGPTPIDPAPYMEKQ